ncbi:amidohydrolase family protein [Streptomyces sp. RS2]|uniref:amidohydrolase family protein n=1 Tax=Streptomyces sp. RS2 TaxID=1451205 RepID=UPI0021F8F153|nr:amidohydrolase family protein [Streptomyces sp. RS2]MCW1100269.1 amidohydrolase family protein [Streptomyces sp. RS2]
MSTTPYIVDAHHHVWELTVRDQDWITGPELDPLRRDFTLSDLTPLARHEGVCASVVVQTVTAAEETMELLSLAAEHNIVRAIVGWTDLTATDVTQEIGRLRELPGGQYLAGVRHQVQSEPDPDWLTRPDVLNGLRAVAAAGLVYDLIVLPHQLPAARRAVLEVPQLTFVLDHLGKPPIASGAVEAWRGDLRRLAELPNVVCKLSGLVTEADWARWTVNDLRACTETALDAFTPDRLMFGSDWPVCTLAASYGDVVASARDLTRGLSPGEQAAVWSGTATRVYTITH